MRILNKRQVKELVSFSPQQIARLEKAGQFLRREQLGPDRVGWVEIEIFEWLKERLAQHRYPPSLLKEAGLDVGHRRI